MSGRGRCHHTPMRRRYCWRALAVAALVACCTLSFAEGQDPSELVGPESEVNDTFVIGKRFECSGMGRRYCGNAHVVSSCPLPCRPEVIISVDAPPHHCTRIAAAYNCNWRRVLRCARSMHECMAEIWTHSSQIYVRLMILSIDPFGFISSGCEVSKFASQRLARKGIVAYYVIKVAREC